MADKIRVMQIIRSFNIASGGGGEERFVTEIVKKFDQRRFEISVCGLWEVGTIEELDRRHALNSMNISTFIAARWKEKHPYCSMWNAMRGLGGVLRSYPVDIIHVHSPFGEMAVLPVRFYRNPPKLIQTIHTKLKVEFILRSLRRFLLSSFLDPFLFDREIGVSAEVVEMLDHRLLSRLFGKKAILVANGINLERFSNLSFDIPAKRCSLGIPSDALVVGSIGRLVKLKGWTYLIHSASLVLRQEPDVYFVIIGDGKLMDQLKYQAEQAGISSHVVFTGGRSDVEELLLSLDLFVSSSLKEALPTVVLESMAAGIPIVATNIPGTRDLIHDKQNGWLVPPADSTALAKAILIALKDSKSRREFSERLYRDVQPFTIESVVSEYERIYSTVIKSA